MTGSVLHRAVVSYWTMGPRKNKPPANAMHTSDRFRPDDIVRAIEAVQRAGLIICGVEITKNGSIKIETWRKASDDKANAERREQLPPAKSA